MMYIYIYKHQQQYIIVGTKCCKCYLTYFGLEIALDVISRRVWSNLQISITETIKIQINYST